MARIIVVLHLLILPTLALAEDRLPMPDYHRQPSDPPWLAQLVQFHGHLGPAVIAGARVGMIGLRAVEAKGYFDVEVTCEGPMAKPPQACFLDGVQVATGATMGKRTLTWVQADQIVVRVRNTQTGKAVELRPTPALMELLASFKSQPKAGTDHGAGQKADDRLEAVARKIVELPEKKIVRMTLLMNVTSVTPVSGSAYPAGTERITYTSAFDGTTDWALFMPGDPRKNTVVYLHGSFAEADQIFTRKDIRDFWLTRIRDGHHGLLSVNLRGTSYMSPAATADLTDLLGYCKDNLGCKRFVLLGGSGGASSAMAYAVLHPEKVHGVVAMGMCDVLQRLDFARKSENPVLQKLAATVFAAYGGSLEEKPGLYQDRSVLAHADRLTMPVILTMGEADPLIPVVEARKIAAAMKGKNNFVYHEIPKGGHDAALWVDIDLETLQIRKPPP